VKSLFAIVKDGKINGAQWKAMASFMYLDYENIETRLVKR